MKRRISRVLGALVSVGVLAAATTGATAFADGPGQSPFPLQGPGRAVFVQTDGLAGNQVVVYDRRGDGTLSYAATYPTGGLGGAADGLRRRSHGLPGLPHLRPPRTTSCWP